MSVLDTNDQNIDSLINTYVIEGTEDDRLLNFDDFLNLDISSENLDEPQSEGEDTAFIMYTSGTTSNNVSTILNTSSFSICFLPKFTKAMNRGSGQRNTA